MELQLLNKDELTAVYQNEMVADFPKAELKPLSAMLRLMDLGRYDPLLVKEGVKPIGYALAWRPEGREGALLAFALSVDNISAGLCTGTVSLPTIILLLLTTAIHFFALKLGLLSGKMLSDKTNGFAWLGGAILMVLAFLRLV